MNAEAKALAATIKKILVSGKQIPEEIYIQAIILKIRQLFPNKSEEELAAELLEAKEKFRTYIPPQLQLSPKKSSSKKDLITAQKEQKLKTLSTYYNKGWVLTGFPNNYSQVLNYSKSYLLKHYPFMVL